MKIKKLKSLNDNRYIRAIRKVSDHGDIISEMMSAESDEKLLFLAKQIIAKEKVRQEMGNNVVEEIYGGDSKA